MKEVMKRLWTNEQGLETVEYAIILGLIVAGVVLTITSLGAWVKLQFDSLKSELGA